jgi:DNA-binding response OmpR family regulator/signal transduction histidine kinase
LKIEDRPGLELRALQERLTKLSEASLRINENLDFDSVLQDVVDSARNLTDARYGGMTVLDDEGRFERFVTSGLKDEERRILAELPESAPLFRHLNGVTEPLRIDDLSQYLRSLDLSGWHPPVAVTSFLVAPVRNGGVRMGSLYLTKGQEGREFTREDEETLVMFASQAALVIANARRYSDEQRARADLEALVNTSPVGVVVFDAKTGVPVSHNRETLRIVEGLLDPNRPPEQIMEILSLRRMDGREVSLEESSLADRLSAGRTIRAEEIVIQAPDGRSVTTLVNATPIYSGDGADMESVVVTLQDMTPLEELERLRAEFLGMVSHELRAPLTSVKGSAATLLDDSANLNAAEMRQFHRIINEQADRMRRIITDLLDVAHIETGMLSVNPEPCSAAVLVDHAKTSFVSGGGGNDLQIDLPPDLPAVMADRQRIAQVLSNLLANAGKYSREFSTVRLRAERQGLHLAFSVTDEGRGVSAERLPYLFRKYVRIEGDSAGRQIEGSGLGLAICKGIVEAHGGRIWAESEGQGRGARFTFTLPVAEQTESEQTISRQRLSGRRGHEVDEHARILVVDDDPQTLRHVRDVLSRAGYAPIVTADPNEAVRLMESDRPQLVLLDLVFPDTDGVELMQDILDIAEVPVIFLTAYGRDQNIERAFDMGAADYMAKPFSPTELTARIKAALRKHAGLDHDEPPEPFALGDLTIDYFHRRVHVAGRQVHLTPIEYDLLRILSVNAGRALSHDQLLRRVWHITTAGDPQVVRTHLRRLRRKLGDDADNPSYIFTEPGVGYRMPEEEPA